MRFCSCLAYHRFKVVISCPELDQSKVVDWAVCDCSSLQSCPDVTLLTHSRFLLNCSFLLLCHFHWDHQFAVLLLQILTVGFRCYFQTFWGFLGSFVLLFCLSMTFCIITCSHGPGQGSCVKHSSLPSSCPFWHQPVLCLWFIVLLLFFFSRCEGGYIPLQCWVFSTSV